MRWRSPVRVVVLLAFVALGCGGSSHSPSEPRRQDSLTLVSLSPVEGSSLHVSEPTAITARLRYSFATAARGRIALVAYPAPSGLPSGPPIFTDPFFFTVEGSEGETTVHFTIYPNLGEPGELASHPPINVDLSLFPEGVVSTQIHVQAHYRLIS